MNLKLQASLTLSLTWDPPVDFESLSGYEVILSRQAVGRFATPSSISESETATISVRYNSNYTECTLSIG